MFFGALLAGALPWMLTVRESQLRAVAALGGGLLIGTSLAIVIPEGFHALAEVGGGRPAGAAYRGRERRRSGRRRAGRCI